MDINELTPVFKKAGNDYVAWIEEIPGVNTQGATIEEAREHLQEALDLILDELQSGISK